MPIDDQSGNYHSMSGRVSHCITNNIHSSYGQLTLETGLRVPGHHFVAVRVGESKINSCFEAS